MPQQRIVARKRSEKQKAKESVRAQHDMWSFGKEARPAPPKQNKRVRKRIIRFV